MSKTEHQSIILKSPKCLEYVLIPEVAETTSTLPLFKKSSIIKNFRVCSGNFNKIFRFDNVKP